MAARDLSVIKTPPPNRHPIESSVIRFSEETIRDAISYEIILSKNKDLHEAGAKLYDALHELDHLNLDVIIAERLPDTGLGKSVNDRLQRAAFH